MEQPVVRAKAPLRLGLAGGGTDVSPYCDTYGGMILNATINLYVYATLAELTEPKIIVRSFDTHERYEYPLTEELPLDGHLDLLKGVYNHVVKNFTHKPLAIDLAISVDAPAGSGLGTSSTVVVAVLGAFVEWLRLPLGHHDIAHTAYVIERVELGMAGGKQDQYAATFGGFNFLEVYDGDRVVVNPLRIRPEYLRELEFCLLLYFTGVSRLSSKIIEAQTRTLLRGHEKSMQAMHQVKAQAIRMKEVILRGKLEEIGGVLDLGWHYKKQTAEGVSSPWLDEIYAAALASGATGGKISGAGGGGYMFFYCPRNSRFQVMERLKQFGGEIHRFLFDEHGLQAWQSR